jgi:hypothetical protein
VCGLVIDGSWPFVKQFVETILMTDDAVFETPRRGRGGIAWVKMFQIQGQGGFLEAKLQRQASKLEDDACLLFLASSQELGSGPLVGDGIQG